MKLNEGLKRLRPVLLFLVLLGVLSNRTFLAWTSSGLETALFNFSLILWLLIMVMKRQQTNTWLLSLTGSAVMVYLSRPDGILVILATILILLFSLIENKRAGTLNARWFGAVSPILLSGVHLTWRLMTYGEWLPNTYYAKYVSAWPEAGARYFTSFVIEYGLLVWFALLAVLITHLFRGSRVNRTFVWTKQEILALCVPSRTICKLVAAGVVVAHVGYYTFVIGGDHFEYRVYSYLVPLIFLSFVWMISKINIVPKTAVLLLIIFVLFSWPVQWTHWVMTKDFTMKDDTHRLRVPVHSAFPVGTQWYAKIFDDNQNWLIERYIGTRHQGHKLFAERQINGYPSRSFSSGDQYDIYPIFAVGVPGWVFPDVAIIDLKGLNDYVIARHDALAEGTRLMAHERKAPEGYLESFSINWNVKRGDNAYGKKRKIELTPSEIAANEKYWIDKIVHKIDAVAPPFLELRQGEYQMLYGRYSEAIPFLEEAIVRHPNDYRIYFQLSICMFHTQQPDQAIMLLEKAYELNPGGIDIVTNLGCAYIEFGLVPGSVGKSVEENRRRGETLLGEALKAGSISADKFVQTIRDAIKRTNEPAFTSYLTILKQYTGVPTKVFIELGELLSTDGYHDQAQRTYQEALARGVDYNKKELIFQRYPMLKGASHE